MFEIGKIRKNYRRLTAFMLTMAMVLTNVGMNLTTAFAAGEEENALFLLEGDELQAAIRKAKEQKQVFKFSSLSLKAGKKSVRNKYEKLLGAKDGDVYQLDLDIDDSYALEDTSLEVFYHADTEDVIFLFVNESDMIVSFRANVDGYETASVTVNPNTANVEDEEDASFAENYEAGDMINDVKKAGAEVLNQQTTEAAEIVTEAEIDDDEEVGAAESEEETSAVEIEAVEEETSEVMTIEETETDAEQENVSRVEEDELAETTKNVEEIEIAETAEAAEEIEIVEATEEAEETEMVEPIESEEAEEMEAVEDMAGEGERLSFSHNEVAMVAVSLEGIGNEDGEAVAESEADIESDEEEVEETDAIIEEVETEAEEKEETETEGKKEETETEGKIETTEVEDGETETETEGTEVKGTETEATEGEVETKESVETEENVETRVEAETEQDATEETAAIEEQESAEKVETKAEETKSPIADDAKKDEAVDVAADGQLLEDDSVDFYGEVEGKAFDTVTIWEHVNARAFKVSAQIFDRLIGNEEETGTEYFAETETAVVTVWVPNDAFDEKVDLKVRDIVEGSEEFEKLSAQINEQLEGQGKALLDVSFCDVTFLNADGLELEPTVPVSVKIRYLDEGEVGESSDEISLFHIHDEEVTQMKQAIVEENSDGETVIEAEFDRFSVVARVAISSMKVRIYGHKMGRWYKGDGASSGQTIPGPEDGRNVNISESKFDFNTFGIGDTGWIDETVINDVSGQWTCVGFVPFSGYIEEEGTGRVREANWIYNHYCHFDTLDEAKTFVIDNKGVLYGEEATDETFQALNKTVGTTYSKIAQLMCVWYVGEVSMGEDFHIYEEGYKNFLVQNVEAVGYKPTSDKVSVEVTARKEIEGSQHIGVISYQVTIDEEAEEESLNINLHEALENAVIKAKEENTSNPLGEIFENGGIQPGDEVRYEVTIIDKSGQKYAYESGSGEIGTVQPLLEDAEIRGTGFDGYPIYKSDSKYAFTPWRSANLPLKKLMGEEDIYDWDCTDEKIGKALRAYGYGKEELSDEEITREYLDDYYLDYYNNLNEDAYENIGKEGYGYAYSFDQLDGNQLSALITTGNIYGFACQPETNPVIVNALYYLFYGDIYTIEGASVYDWMAKERDFDSLVSWDEDAERHEFKISSLVDGEKAGNGNQNFQFMVGIQFRVVKPFVDIKGQKTWNDHNDQDGKRPEKITIKLLANEKEIDNCIVTADNEWKWEFTKKPKYANSKEIEYEVREEKVRYYEPVYSEEGYDIINVYTPEESKPEETTPEETTPEETTPEETTPEETSPEETTPEETSPEETTPEETSPEETTPEETTPKETSPEETTPEETSPEETTPEETSQENSTTPEESTSSEEQPTTPTPTRPSGGRGNGGGSGSGSGGSSPRSSASTPEGGPGVADTVTIDNPDVPLANFPETEPETLMIEEEDVPLANFLPKTGDARHMAMWMMIFGGAGIGMIATLLGLRKKREDGEG